MRLPPFSKDDVAPVVACTFARRSIALTMPEVLALLKRRGAA